MNWNSRHEEVDLEETWSKITAWVNLRIGMGPTVLLLFVDRIYGADMEGWLFGIFVVHGLVKTWNWWV